MLNISAACHLSIKDQSHTNDIRYVFLIKIP